MKQTFILRPAPHPARARALEAVRCAPEGLAIEIREPTRTLEQNALMWPLLNAVSEQVEWYGQMLSPDDWKDLFTAVLRKARAVPGLDGGFVVLGLSTSKLGKKEFSDLIEIIYAFGAERGVNFGEPA